MTTRGLGSENNEALRKVGLFVRSGSPFLGTAEEAGCGVWDCPLWEPPATTPPGVAARDAVGGLTAWPQPVSETLLKAAAPLHM